MTLEQIRTVDNNFVKAYESAISGEELRKRLYNEMRQWEWNEK